MHGTLVGLHNCYKKEKINQILKKIHMQYQREQCLIDIQSETRQSTTNYYAKTRVH